jgi:hypothetical protein
MLVAIYIPALKMLVAIYIPTLNMLVAIYIPALKCHLPYIFAPKCLWTIYSLCFSSVFKYPPLKH